MATKGTGMPPVIGDPKHPIKNRILREAVVMYDGIVRYGDAGFFLDFGPRKIYDHLVAHVGLSVAVGSVGQEASGAVASARVEEQAGERMLARLELLIDGLYPHGHARRAAFFPSGPGNHSLGERLLAIAGGLQKYGGSAMPSELGAEKVRQAAERIGEARSQRESEKQKKTNTVTSRSHLVAKTREFHDRVGSYLRGYLGKDSPELAKFGIKIPRLRGGTRRKRKVEVPA